MSDPAAPEGTESASDGRSHLDHLVDEVLDRFLFAPVALLASPDDLRALADKGRTLVRNQTTMARFIGQIAVTSATRKVKARIDEQRTATATTPTNVSASKHTAAPRDPAPEPQIASGTAAKPPARMAPTVPLPIEGYDTLAASQIVPLLSGLSAAQLDAVESHERAGRNRKTVLNRIAQLR